VSDNAKTAFLWDERTLWHDPSLVETLGGSRFVEPYEHWENAAAKRRIHNLLDASGLLGKLARPRVKAASAIDLERVHEPAYVQRIQALSAASGGDAGSSNATFGPGGYDIACLSAGACMTAIDAVLAGDSSNAYVLTRPPGHHAESDRGRGFCIFGNIAVAARYAQARYEIGRIAIVDWDVHHGNGTQDAFYDDPSVLTISVHQDSCYPTDSGYVNERGRDAGFGFNVNIPLPSGCAVGAYLDAFDRVVTPSLYAFRPELILIASGLDAGMHDPIGRMMLDSENFRTLMKLAGDAASELCEGRVVLCHEGGYSPIYAPFCGLAIIEELAGIRTDVVDPFLAARPHETSAQPLAHQREAVDAVVAELDLATLNH
jgi:acetoin utilization deacetylase AcuC-like enzyme